MPTYYCNNCGERHEAMSFCPRPIQSEKDRYRALLIAKFDQFVIGYGGDYQVHFAALKTKLFSDTASEK